VNYGKTVRLISRIDVKNNFVIKGIHLEGLRKVGDPILIAKKYYQEGIDEIIFMDAVASLYERNNLFNIINNATKHVFVPITIGGGIRKLEDIEQALNSGADKIAINTQAIKTPEFIEEASRIYGSQAIIGSIEAKKKGDTWEAYIDNGRQETGMDAIKWATELESKGAGELLITSIDKEGTKKGFEEELIQLISRSVSIPVISSGGAGNADHIISLCEKTDTSGIAIASIFHYQDFQIDHIKNQMIKNNLNVRK
jgi:cyclase